MTNSNSSGNNPPPQQQQIIFSGNTITATPGQWITISLPQWVTTPTISNLLDLPEDIAEVKAKKSDGCTCKKCREFYPYAEPNQKDGTLVCYGCRMIW